MKGVQMPFSNPNERYASFGIVTSLPSELIDSFWFVIDKNLTGVFDLISPLHFRILKNADNQVSLEYRSNQTPSWIQFDLPYPFDPSYPREVYIVEQNRTQVILLPDEFTG